MGLVPVGITVGEPHMRLGYQLRHRVRVLAPTGKLFSINVKSLFATLYIERLNNIGLESIRRELEGISEENGGKDLVLLCFEDVHKPGEWCHRQIFAKWWEEETGERVDELPPGIERLIDRP